MSTLGQRFLTVLMAATLAGTTKSYCQVIGPYAAPPGRQTEAPSLPPVRFAENVPIENPIVLRSAEEGARDQIDAMEVWNRSGGRPLRAGFSAAD